MLGGGLPGAGTVLLFMPILLLVAIIYRVPPRSLVRGRGRLR